MYESFYGLREKPFNLLPDPDYLFMGPGHEHVFTHLEYSILENKGFVVVTGEIGAGKTTLINHLLKRIAGKALVGLVQNTSVPPLTFLRMVLREFDLPAEGLDKAGLVESLNSFLIRQFARKKRVVLIVDEAQNLPRATLEEIRMISNLETEKHHLIQIILVGQPELAQKLRRPGLEQFLQRVTVSCHLRALTPDETRQYIRHRLEVAGAGGREIFPEPSIDLVYEHTRGIPRLVNAICDTALVYGYAAGAPVVTPEIVGEVVQDREGPSPGGEETPRTGLGDDGSRGETAVSADIGDRLDAMERRIRLLEGTVTEVLPLVVAQGGASARRDDAMAALVRMLRDAFAGQRRVIEKYALLKSNIASAQQKGPKEEHPPSAPAGRGFLSRMKPW